MSGSCAHERTRVRWEAFADGTAHLREECRACGRFLSWARQDPDNLASAGPRPGAPAGPAGWPDRDLSDQLADYGGLSDWESEFADSITRQVGSGRSLSEKQRAKCVEIIEKRGETDFRDDEEED